MQFMCNLEETLVKVEAMLSPETTFSVGVVGWVAGENLIKAISSSKFKLKLKMSLAISQHISQKLKI